MEIEQTWVTTLKNNIMGAGDVTPPIEDVFDPTVFYVSDGWGTAYGALRFRKLSLETGEELANVLTRNTVRCICESKESIYAVLDKRILKLKRRDFCIEETYTKNIPRYSDYVNFISEDVLILMNYVGETLQRFDFQMQKSYRKKIGEKYSFFNVIKADADKFFIFHETAVFEYSSIANKVKKLLDIEPCIKCTMDSAGKTYLLCRDSVKKNHRHSSKILVYPLLAENNFEALLPGCIADFFWISEKNHQLYLAYNNKLWVYSIDERRLIFHYTFETGFVYNIFDATNSILTYDAKNKCLSCYKIK